MSTLVMDPHLTLQNYTIMTLYLLGAPNLATANTKLMIRNNFLFKLLAEILRLKGLEGEVTGWKAAVLPAGIYQ